MAATTDLKTFLKTLPGFEGFAGAYLDTLASAMKVQLYPKGHTFIWQGEQGQALYMIIDGAVMLSRSDELTGFKQERELRAGDVFGLLSLIDNLPAAATCTVLEPVTAASLPRADFNDLFDDAPPVGHHILYMVAIQLARDLQDRNMSLRALVDQRAKVA
jgi:CRP-like cAMP-binding protein